MKLNKSSHFYQVLAICFFINSNTKYSKAKMVVLEFHSKTSSPLFHNYFFKVSIHGMVTL